MVWDGTVDDGRPGEAAAFVCIEAARERGPYSLIREPIAIDGAPFTLTLPDHQELTEAEVSYVV